MPFCSILLQGWKTNGKNVVRILSLLLFMLVLPETVAEVIKQKNTVVLASDGHKYEVLYTAPLNIKDFNILSLNGNIPSREVVAELYIAAGILNRPPTVWDIYEEEDELRKFVDSESKHTANWNKWHTAATFIGSLSAGYLSSVISGATKITTSLIQSEVIQGAIHALTTITIVVGDEQVFTQAYSITMAYVDQAESKKQVYDELVWSAEFVDGTEISIDEIKSAHSALLQASIYVEWVHWMMNEYLVLPDRLERLWEFAKSVFPLTALGQFFASAGENIEDLRRMNQLFDDSVERITQQVTPVVDAYFSDNAKANAIDQLEREGFFDRQPPIIVDTINNIELTIGGQSQVRDVRANFSDPNGDELRYSLKVTDDNIADVEWILFREFGESELKTLLQITPKNLGTTTVTITATDPYELSATLSFTVTVIKQPPYEPPEPVRSIDPQILTLGSGATTKDVEQNFNCSNELTYEAWSNPTGIVTVSISDTIVTITPIAAGVTTVLVRARDTVNTHLTAIQTFSVVVRQTSAVIVRPPNNDPTFDVPDNSNPRAEGLREGVSVKVQVTTVLNVRSEPDIHTGEILEQIGNITGIITDGPREADGYTWWKIDWDPINLEGWSAEVIGGKQVLFRRPPDLEISRFDVSSSTVPTGENIELEVRIENNGPGESAETEVYFYYHSGSRNYDLDDLSQETDLRIPGTGKLTVPSLQENRRTTLTLTVDAPETPDRYYYGAFLPSNVHDTDYKGDLTIPMLNNNLAGEKRVQVTGSPDYIVESISVSKTTLDPGQSFTLSATVLNQGIGEPTSSATLRYYRSSDARISTSDRRVGQGSVSRLGSDDTSRESVSLTAPSAPGVYYYGACVSGVSNESNTNNNCSAAVAITVQASKPDETAVPDLVVETPTTGTTTLEPGGSFTLNATVRNKGTANSPAPTFRWYRSPNANISINDTEIGSANISSLSAGTTNTQQINLTAPTAAGTYFYGGCVESSIGESDTTNNCSSAITITVQNRAPTKVGTITVPTLSVGDTPVRLDVAPYFSDLNDDSLTYTVSSSDTNVVSAETSGVSGSNLNIHPIAEGNATITVTASDGELTATQTFSVTVNPISNTISSNTTLITQAHSILALAFNPNQGSNTIAFGSADNHVQLWNTDTAVHQRTLQGHTNYVLSVAFSPNGQILASGDANGTVNVWNAHTGNLNYTLRRHANSVFSIAFSPDGQTLASGSLDGTIRLWDPATGQPKSVLTGNLAPILTVAFSPDGNTFASGNSDGTIHLWSVSNRRIIHTFRGHKDFVLSVAFNHDGSALASGSADSTVQVWNTLTRNLEHTLTEHTDWVNSVAFNPSPGSWTLASGSSDGTVRLWDQNTGTQHSLTEHKNSVESISFSADGNTLASGSADGTVLLWDLTQSPSGQPTLDTEKMEIKEDVNGDGVVNILDLAIVSSLFGTTGDNDADVNEDGVVDIIDLVLVANAFGDVASAPAMRHLAFEYLTPQQVSKWLQEAKALRDTTPEFQRGILVLEQILAMFTPQKTALLPNYPNPFNPETWIPYQLASPADVSISIYAADGKMVRTLDLGNQVVGIYKSRSRAAYWDGKNTLGEPVASGVYFYTFTAGEFTATRKMLIRK